MTKLDPTDRFVDRHIGPNVNDIGLMLNEIEHRTIDSLIDSVVPKSIRLKKELDLPVAKTEREVLAELRTIASQNELWRTFIGTGYHGTVTPPVIQRNILENPGWYTQYTPYQAEISQGRLEALLNYQTMIVDFTGLPVANASLLDEATACAEAMALAWHNTRSHELSGKTNSFFVSNTLHPQSIAVIQTRAEPLGINVVIEDHNTFDFIKKPVFGAVVQYPNTYGDVLDYTVFINKAHDRGALAIVSADLMSLTLLKSPGEMGADIAVGSTQRFGVPLGFGGPHAAFMAVKEELKRVIPGRIVGLSQDAHGRPAIRLALQTREQHIRREKATSNICTAQVLLAITASMYAVYHGPKGLRKIAFRIHALTQTLASGLTALGYEVETLSFFDNITLKSTGNLTKIVKAAETKKINLRYHSDGRISINVDETTTSKDLNDLFDVFSDGKKSVNAKSIYDLLTDKTGYNKALERSSNYLTHPVFNTYHSETELLRYMTRLQGKDLSLTTSMISLGSCTMKLNATAEMAAITWPEFGSLHPFAPLPQTQGYLKLFKQLEGWLSEITGFSAVSLQPNAGSQGEYAGLLVIRKFHESRGEKNRDICLIPRSAHGTNPASAAMCGMKIVVVDCDSSGNVDLTDLRNKAELHSANLSAAMITYPSTHGVFEEGISEFCEIIHKNGGQVYMDGANMNAQVGLCRPGDFGPDVCHLNLHKTFCIPHGGGGPGMGPIGVKSHLVSFLPTHPLVEMPGTDKKNSIGAVSAAPWGSPSILPISWAYIAMMGTEGLKTATKTAILNANYIAKKLNPHFPVLYRGKAGHVAHECIVDLRQLKDTTGIEVEDVAKRLMDYGYHAPTVSFPVPGTMMIEPTESESLRELDRFCDAMISIRKEIAEIEKGQSDKKDNVLKNAPHTSSECVSSEWNHQYSREKAAFPASWTKENKFWPAVSRINGVLGDRNLICACPPIDSY